MVWCHAVVLTTAVGACHRPPSGSDAPTPAVASPAAPCPIVPVALVMTPPTGESRTILSLDAKGSLDVSFIDTKRGVAQLTQQGCLVGSDGLWSEWAPHDKLWTPHETLDVAGDCLVLNASRSLCVAADGKIETRAKNEPPLPKDLATMAIRGYGPDARCASMLLLATFTGMMPSMAVVDGKPRRAPPPEGSRCAAFRRP
jgi:hypothetical protein